MIRKPIYSEKKLIIIITLISIILTAVSFSYLLNHSTRDFRSSAITSITQTDAPCPTNEVMQELVKTWKTTTNYSTFLNKSITEYLIWVIDLIDVPYQQPKVPGHISANMDTLYDIENFTVNAVEVLSRCQKYRSLTTDELQIVADLAQIFNVAYTKLAPPVDHPDWKKRWNKYNITNASTNEGYWKENTLDSTQFLYLVNRLYNLIVSLKPAEKSFNAKLFDAFVQNYSPVLIDTYERWNFDLLDKPES